jgi:hypothetical protein
MIRMRACDLARTGTILSAAVFILAAGCSSATRHTDSSRDGPTLAFDNATVDEVAVYIDHAGSRWILGHVEPGRASLLRVPDSANLRDLSDVRLIAIPLGATRDGLRGIDIANAICSEFESAKQMLTMRWSLKGHTLVSTVTPSGR